MGGAARGGDGERGGRVEGNTERQRGGVGEGRIKAEGRKKKVERRGMHGVWWREVVVKEEEKCVNIFNKEDCRV